MGSSRPISANTYQSKINKPTSGDARGDMRKGFESSNRAPAPEVKEPSAPAPTPTPTPAPVSFSTCLEKSDIKKIKSVTEEFYMSNIMEEPYIVIKELVPSHLMHECVKVLMASSVERKEGDRIKLLSLLVELHRHTGAYSGLPPTYLSSEDTTRGIYSFLEDLSDLVIDAPMAGTYGANLVAGLIVHQVVNMSIFCSIPETEDQNFVNAGRPAEFIAQVLSSIALMKDTAEAQQIYAHSGVAISSFIRTMPRETMEQALNELATKHNLPFLTEQK